MRTALILVAALAATAPARPAGADTITVDAAGGGDYVTIQAALDAAIDGDTIEVVAGTYTGDGNWDLEFGTKNVHLVGLSGSTYTTISAQTESGHRLMRFYSGGQDTTCLIEGFTIIGGKTYQAGTPGAGIYIDGSMGTPPSPKFKGCMIAGNIAYGGNGGGVYINNNCNPVFQDCIFNANSCLSSGAGVYVSGSSTPIFRECEFANNQCSTGFGGAIAFNYSGLAIVRDSIMWSNTSGDQGGAVGCFRSNPTIYNVAIYHNTATTTGGAVYSKDADPDFAGCTFVQNRALAGGSIYHSTWAGSLPTFTDCIMSFSEAAGGRGSTYLCDESGDAMLIYCNSYGNPDGDTPCGTVMLSIEEDPLFCNVWGGDYTLASNSPCLPAGNAWGRHMGSEDEGCVESPVTETSWGSIKALYR